MITAPPGYLRRGRVLCDAHDALLTAYVRSTGVSRTGTSFRCAAEAGMGWRVAVHAREGGAVIRPLGDVVVLMPPLAIPIPELERLAEITCSAIEASFLQESPQEWVLEKRAR